MEMQKAGLVVYMEEACINKKYRILFFILFFLFINSPSYCSDNNPKRNSVDSLISSGYASLKMKDTTSALRLAEEALSYSNKNGYEPGIKSSLLLLARIFKSQNKFSQTLDYYLQLLSETASGQAGDRPLQALAFTEIGSLYFDLGLSQKALDYFLKVDTSVLEKVQKVQLIKEIGDAFEKVKRYDKSRDYYQEVLQFYEDESYKKQKAGVLVKLSDISKKLNLYKDAAGYELQNLKLRKELNDTVAIGVALNNLGTINKYLGQNVAALDYFLQSYQLKMDTGDKIGIAITSINISIMYQMVEDYDESLKYLQKALEIQKGLGRYREVTHTCNLIAAVYYYKKNYLKAESFSLDAISYGKKVNAIDLLETSCKILSHVYRIQGNNEAALEYYQKFSDIKDSIALQQKIQQQELYHKYLEVENKEAQIKDLRIEKELQELEFKKLQLEKEKKDKEWELLKRDKDLQEIIIRQQQLQQEKAINLLLLKEQQYRADASDQELKLLKQQQLLKDKEKQNKIQALKTSSEINALKLSKQEAELRMQKIWQVIIVGLFIIIMIIISLVFNRYKLKQKASQSKLANKNLEVEQKFLRAQMNPHFIFNALNSIQSYVTLNDTYEAERYLAKFSRLMRYILDNTGQPNITIEKEIKTLQLYLELEQLRFDFKFNFHIVVSPDIDQELVVIPPMLTQPFVENAIIHGFMNKNSKGYIEIKFNREGETIICTITDNGIGRAEAARLKKNASGKHRSMGMQVTKDRLDLLNEVHGSIFEALVTDLIDESGKPSGTRVDLKVLYKEA